MERLLLEEKGSASIRRTPDGECLLPSGMVVNDAYRVESRVGPPRTRTTYIVRHMISSQKRTLRLFEAGPGILSAVQEATGKPINRHFIRLPARFQDQPVEEDTLALDDLKKDEIVEIAKSYGFSDSDLKGLNKKQVIILLSDVEIDLEAYFEAKKAES